MFAAISGRFWLLRLVGVTPVGGSFVCYIEVEFVVLVLAGSKVGVYLVSGGYNANLV